MSHRTARRSPLSVYDELRAMVGDGPSWHAQAVCRQQGVNPAWFFPQVGDPGTRAKMICAQCTVRDQCAAAGAREPIGIWGGLTGRDRRNNGIASRRQRALHLRAQGWSVVDIAFELDVDRRHVYRWLETQQQQSA